MGGNEFVDKFFEYGDFYMCVLILGYVVCGGLLSVCDCVLVSKFGLYVVEFLKEGKGGLCIGMLDN